MPRRDIASIIDDWPEVSKDGAETTPEAYGDPDQARGDGSSWHQAKLHS